MADEMNVAWPPENIPDEHLLYMRVQKNWFGSDGKLILGVFRNLPTPQDGMSTDWGKYSSARDAQGRGRVPSDNAVIQLNVGQVRQIPNQSVVHTPDLASNNRAHTEVFGEKNSEARLKLSRIYDLAIPLGQ